MIDLKRTRVVCPLTTTVGWTDEIILSDPCVAQGAERIVSSTAIRRVIKCGHCCYLLSPTQGEGSIKSPHPDRSVDLERVVLGRVDVSRLGLGLGHLRRVSRVEPLDPLADLGGVGVLAGLGQPVAVVVHVHDVEALQLHHLVVLVSLLDVRRVRLQVLALDGTDDEVAVQALAVLGGGHVPTLDRLVGLHEEGLLDDDLADAIDPLEQSLRQEPVQPTVVAGPRDAIITQEVTLVAADVADEGGADALRFSEPLEVHHRDGLRHLADVNVQVTPRVDARIAEGVTVEAGAVVALGSHCSLSPCNVDCLEGGRSLTTYAHGRG